MSAAADLAPGKWVTVGTFAHQVRCSDAEWTEWVCDRPLSAQDVFRSPTGGHRTGWVRDRVAATAEDVQAGDVTPERCSRCAVLSNLGPLPPTITGEVRRSPDGLVAVAGSGTNSDRRWKLVHSDPDPFGYGWRGDWDVADWVTVGNVLTMAGQK